MGKEPFQIFPFKRNIRGLEPSIFHKRVFKAPIKIGYSYSLSYSPRDTPSPSIWLS